MVIQGYDEFFEMYNKQNDEEVITIGEGLSLLIAICVFLKGIFMIVIISNARISNDTLLNQIKASEGPFLLGFILFLVIFYSRMNDTCKEFYKNLCFDDICKNQELVAKIDGFNISGLIDVIKRRIDRREKMYKAMWLIFTVLIIPAAKAVYDTSNLQDVGLFILFINAVILTVVFAIFCGIGMHYPIRRKTIALYEYLDFLTQYQSINKATKKREKIHCSKSSICKCQNIYVIGNFIK